MPRPMGQLKILFSSRVLFDLERADQIFQQKGIQAYTDFLRCEGDCDGEGDPALGGFRRLGKGPMFDFAVALSKLNSKSPDPKKPIIELGLSCKDEIESARPIFRNLAATVLASAFEWETPTAGHPIDERIHKSFKTDLFLTRSAADAQTAIDLDIAAAVINFPPHGTYDYEQEGPVRIIVDGDAVAFGDSAEVGFRNDVSTHTTDYSKAVTTYKNREHDQCDQPIEVGPFTVVLAKIAELNSQFPKGQQPFEIGLLTARGAKAADRALTTLEEYGVKFNYPSGFMGGSDKGEWLEAHRPHLFLDDQTTHLDRAKAFCPTGLVPYKSGGPMHTLLQEQAKKAFSNEAGQKSDKPVSRAGAKARKGIEPGAKPK